jgi:hypothetical protein
MKSISIHTLALTAATVVLLGLAGSSTASADSLFTIHIGTQGPPPDRQDYHQWQSPDHTAVWIPGHNEWRDGQYVWVGGYYGYPPHRHNHWVAPSYPHNQDGYSYRPGHWAE